MGERPHPQDQPHWDTQAAAAFLERHYLGPANARPQGEIARRMGFDVNGDMGRSVAPGCAAFSELMERCMADGYPVCWNSDGYFYATHYEQSRHMMRHAETCLARWQQKLTKMQRAMASLEPDKLPF